MEHKIPLLTSERTFELISNTPVISNRFIMNCHKCGKTFSPLLVLLNPTDKCDYYLGTWCRLNRYIILGEDKNSVCEHLPEQGFIWLYDPKDNMQGKIANL